MTSSMGVYLTGKNEEAGEVLFKADQTLYAAKNRGKNRIIFYGEDNGGIN